MRPEADVETVDRIPWTAGFVRVDPAELDPPSCPPSANFALGGSRRPVPPLVAAMPARPRPKRRAGRVAEPSLF